MTAFLPRASRRTFLKRGAAITVAFTLAPYFDSLAQGTPPALPGSLQTNRQLDAWLAINADETVTVFTGKVELGQGITTALAQIVADELGVDIARITIISGDTSRTPNEGVTSGSLSIEQGGTALRFAAAEAREILLAAAAAKIGVPASALTVSDGVITAPDGKRTSYGEVAGADLLRREASAKAKPRPAAAHTVIGTSVARRDIPAKVTGGVAYVQDMRLPDMLFGRVVRPPSYRAKLVSLDDAAVRALPGVTAVARNGSFLAVAAEREEQAIVAAQALRDAAKWDEPADLPPAGAALFASMKRARSQDAVVSEKINMEAATKSVKRIEADYTRPYTAHASIGPSCAVAQWRDGKVTVWCHTQGVFPLRGDLAKALAIPPSDIVVRSPSRETLADAIATRAAAGISRKRSADRSFARSDCTICNSVASPLHACSMYSVR